MFFVFIELRICKDNIPCNVQRRCIGTFLSICLSHKSSTSRISLYRRFRVCIAKKYLIVIALSGSYRNHKVVTFSVYIRRFDRPFEGFEKCFFAFVTGKIKNWLSYLWKGALWHHNWGALPLRMVRAVTASSHVVWVQYAWKPLPNWTKF